MVKSKSRLQKETEYNSSGIGGMREGEFVISIRKKKGHRKLQLKPLRTNERYENPEQMSGREKVRYSRCLTRVLAQLRHLQFVLDRYVWSSVVVVVVISGKFFLFVVLFFFVQFLHIRSRFVFCELTRGIHYVIGFIETNAKYNKSQRINKRVIFIFEKRNQKAVRFTSLFSWRPLWLLPVNGKFRHF